MAGSRTTNAHSELEQYGISSRSVRALHDTPSPDLLDYLDLVEPRSSDTSGPAEVFPDTVAESQGRPLLFIVNESRLAQPPNEQQLDTLRRKLACRGDRAYLARLRPGELLVVPVSLEDKTPEWQLYQPGTPQALTFFARLAHGHYDGQGDPKEADYVFSAMFKLVWSVADRLAALHLKRVDVLSLMGRALFFRFLCDRGVVRDGDLKRIAPKATTIRDCFADAENATATSAWLDKTFNGDLLSLTENGNRDYFDDIGQRTGGRVFTHFSAIIRGEEPSGDENYQLPLGIPDFGDYDFAHVPVGLLSQVYERFAWKWEHQNARETSVHYTPRNIAATLVDEAFTKFPSAYEARVLDPAAGACVFLVFAFRRLYRERWQHAGERPNTEAIREILEKQLAGFDISESAIKLGALSLYLTAIELDPEPVPPEKLKFRHLRNKVLFNFRRAGTDPEEGAVAGSLGEHVGRRFDGQFDLVLSNPPWTSLKRQDRPLAEEFNRLSKAIILRRSDEATAAVYENPDFGPDLPFLWRATEWCKPNGRIAMALPARILLKQEDVPRRARETLLQLVEVTGIINGANLSDTKVWPNMSQPFILLFARNRKPKPGSTLHLITPQYDIELNGKGQMRIDAKSAQPIEVEGTFQHSWVWKTLAVGTSLDMQVIAKLNQVTFPSLEKYWASLGLLSTRGYQVEPDQPQQDASFLIGLPDLTAANSGVFVVETRDLPIFQRRTLSRPRTRGHYEAPLVLMKQAPGLDRCDAWALLSFHDVAYTRTFHGYSAGSREDAELLCRYVHLFAHTNLRMHFALCTKARFGAERRVLDKADIDDCPFFPFEQLSAANRATVAELSGRLVEGDLTVFNDIDSFFGSLFGLSTKDMEVVRDTVDVAMPYSESRERACNPPSSGEREKFRKRLESILRPFFKATGEEPQVDLWKPETRFLQIASPFGLLLISKRGSGLSSPDALFGDLLVRLAEDTGSTRIIHRLNHGIAVALLNQYRYWTPSRARLLGAELVGEHLSVFEE
jgi:type I restriction-modification system DNA methylase subunit